MKFGIEMLIVIASGASIAPTANSLWNVVSGDCSIDLDSCLLSPNFPEPYGNSESCEIYVDEDQAGPIRVDVFQTQESHDYLVVNGVKFDGFNGPADVPPNGTITWTSDSATGGVGWRLCPPTAPSLFSEDEGNVSMWRVLSGNCTIDEDMCASSPNFPDAYGNSERCLFAINLAGIEPIRVEAFETEAGYDFLWVDDVKYDGVVGPSGVSPMHVMVWSSDVFVTRDGWRLCPESVPASLSFPPGAMWAVSEGDCNMDANYCITSPNYPNNYSSNQACTIAVQEAEAGPIEVVSFDTNGGADLLFVNDLAYSGSTGPADVVPMTDIEWSSGSDGGRSGWKICQQFASMWQVKEGSCTMDENQCIMSPNYPEPYTQEACSITVYPPVASPIHVEHFETNAQDWFIVNGEIYSGRSAPGGVTPLVEIEWKPQPTSVPRSGWKLCPAANELAWQHRNGSMWRVAGPCTLEEDFCVQSPNFPGVYGYNQACVIEVLDSERAEPIGVTQFNTEPGFDLLHVDGVAFSGSEGPDGVTPIANITWTSDAYITRTGWRLCPASAVQPLAPTPSPAPASCEDDPNILFDLGFIQPGLTAASCAQMWTWVNLRWPGLRCDLLVQQGHISQEQLDRCPVTCGTCNTATCGQKGTDNSPWTVSRIANGQSSSVCEWPWQVAVLTTYNQSRFFCGGVLLSANHVLTAGHCVTDGALNEPDAVSVIAGETDFAFENGQEVEVNASKIFIHPKYDPDWFGTIVNYDIAVIELAEEIPESNCIRYVCLPHEDIKAGLPVYLTGWGKLQGRSDPFPRPNLLQEAEVTTLSNEDCKFAIELTPDDVGIISDVMVCLNGRQRVGNVGSCAGDSGGPMVHEGEDGRYVLHGITSWGFNDCLLPYPSVYTRVFSFVPWIENVTSGKW